MLWVLPSSACPVGSAQIELAVRAHRPSVAETKMAIIPSAVRIVSTLVIVPPSQAWSVAATTRRASCDALNAAPAPVAALHPPDKPEASTATLLSEPDAVDDTERRLAAALAAARDADRRHGLCSPASARAWEIVDDIYASSWTSRQVEENVRKLLGREENVWGS